MIFSVSDLNKVVQISVTSLQLVTTKNLMVYM